MTYTIIGGDGKEYGPISGEDLRKWVSEGRLNAQSQAKAESDAGFRPLSTFPEFAGIFAPPPLGAAAVPAQDDTHAAQMVKGPAIALIVTGVIDLLLSFWGLGDKLFGHHNLAQFNNALQQMNNPQMEQFFQKIMNFAYGPFGIVDAIFGLAMSILVLMGASKMLSLRSYEFAVTASIVAMIPCVTPCCILGLPFGIWALVVLTKPEVKSSFS